VTKKKVASVLLASSLVPALLPSISDASDPPLAGQEAEEFLQVARVVESRDLGAGVTQSKRLTLSNGERTARAVWKTINVYRPMQKFSDGGFPEIGFRDSYKNEIAAYELDKLLVLHLVPPTVERRIRGERGSLQLWLDDTITEGERMSRGLTAPDTRRWNDQIHRLRIWHQLIDDRDFNNIHNVLVDGDFRIWAIDHSRAFRLGKSLQTPEGLKRFDRELVERLGDLDIDLLRAGLGRWLTKSQLETLLVRRDLILDRVERLVAERGEESVLFP